jgi:hypothetical protein
MAGERQVNSRGAAWDRHGMCESAVAEGDNGCSQQRIIMKVNQATACLTAYQSHAVAVRMCVFRTLNTWAAASDASNSTHFLDSPV